MFFPIPSWQSFCKMCNLFFHIFSAENHYININNLWFFFYTILFRNSEINFQKKISILLKTSFFRAWRCQRWNKHWMTPQITLKINKSSKVFFFQEKFEQQKLPCSQKKNHKQHATSFALKFVSNSKMTKAWLRSNLAAILKHWENWIPYSQVFGFILVYFWHLISHSFLRKTNLIHKWPEAPDTPRFHHWKISSHFFCFGAVN